MSAPDPKAWAITDADWDEMVDKYGHWLELEKPIARIARRRAIEELKALISETYEPYVNQHYGGPAPTLLNADVIFARIAAIEAEEA